MTYQKPKFKERYNNYINGEWIAPVDGDYFEDFSPIDGNLISNVPRSNSKDIDLAVKAAWKAHENWATTSVTERSNILKAKCTVCVGSPVHTRLRAIQHFVADERNGYFFGFQGRWARRRQIDIQRRVS